MPGLWVGLFGAGCCAHVEILLAILAAALRGGGEVAATQVRLQRGSRLAHCHHVCNADVSEGMC